MSASLNARDWLRLRQMAIRFVFPAPFLLHLIFIFKSAKTRVERYRGMAMILICRYTLIFHAAERHAAVVLASRIHAYTSSALAVCLLLLD